MNSEIYVLPTGPSSWDVIEVLHFLKGLSWDVHRDVIIGYLPAVRPSCVRLIAYGAGVAADAMPYRVTIYFTQLRAVQKIEQEVGVYVGDLFPHGHALRCRLQEINPGALV